MTGIFGKIRTITLANIHDLLDKAIDLNSPSVLRQYVRDLEDALNQLKTEAVTAAAAVHTTNREIADLQTKIDTGKSNAAKMKANGHTDLAHNKAVEVVGLQSELEAKKNLLVTQTETSTKLDSVVANITSMHNQMLSKLRELETMDKSSTAQNHAADTLTAAGKLVGNGADVSVDDIESRIQAKNDVATEKLNRAMGDVNVSEDAETSAAADDLLKSL